MGTWPSITPLSLMVRTPWGSNRAFRRSRTEGLKQREKQKYNKLRCCEFKGKQASKIESTSLCCISYTVLHVRDQKNEWSVFVE